MISIINNKSELRAVYETLLFLNECLQYPEVKNRKVLDERIKQVKLRIRDYHRRSKENTLRIIHDDGIYGYISLEQAPDFLKTKEEVEKWFEGTKVIVPRPSLYDCTGQCYTIWYKVIYRREKFFVYHRVGFDV